MDFKGAALKFKRYQAGLDAEKKTVFGTRGVPSCY